MKTILSAITLCLTACAAQGPSPEQLKAMEGSQSSWCLQSPGWNGSSVNVHYVAFGGKSTGSAGGGGTAKCGSSEAVFTNEGKASSKSQ